MPEETIQVKEKNMQIEKMEPNFGLVKFLLLSVLTIGIYAIYSFAKMGDYLNAIAGKHDGKKTMNYWLLMLVVCPLTFGIGFFVWNTRFCGRLGTELARRGLHSKISAGTFWLWMVLGSFVLVGPFVFIYKITTAMNELITDAKKDV